MGAWKNKPEGERRVILSAVRGCGTQGHSWRSVAAHLGVSWETLKAWKRDDPEGKLEVAYLVGRADTGGRIAARLISKALDPSEKGNTRALIHLSKQFLDMAHQSRVRVEHEAASIGTEDAKTILMDRLAQLAQPEPDDYSAP